MGNYIHKKVRTFPKVQKYLDAYGENQINLARAIWTGHKRPAAKKILLRHLSNPINLLSGGILLLFNVRYHSWVEHVIVFDTLMGTLLHF